MAHTVEFSEETIKRIKKATTRPINMFIYEAVFDKIEEIEGLEELHKNDIRDSQRGKT